MKNNKPRLRYWLNLLTLTIFSFALTFLILVIYASNRWAQSHLHPARIIPTGAWLVENNIPYREIELTTKDGLKLAAWYTPPHAEGSGSVILVAHGYNASRPENIYAMFAKHGYGVLAWDFRAHGLSGGDTCSLGYYEQLDVDAALDYLLMQPDVEHIGAWGGSMGAATVILTVAKRPEIEAVVSDSAFPSLEDVIRLNTPIKIMQPFVLFFAEKQSRVDLDQARPVDEIAKISPRAVFIIDGWDGAAVAMSSPYRLFDAAGEPKQLWVEDGVPHLTMYGNDPIEYEKRVIGFFDEYLK
ncbi:MAG: alpha/beta hydrolase [Anaerolineales bacterium]|nr:alpha/beta hydrolase [Anaerolineales bacterium]